MARPATPDVKITEALNPVASPLGIYDRPAQPEPSPLHGVASALSSLSSDLSAWGAKQQAEQKAQDEARGTLEFYKNNEGGFAEGVRSGEIPADKSPAYVNGYQRAAGLASTTSIDSALNGSFTSWDGQTNPDPKAFEDWFRTNISQHVPLNTSGAYAQGLAPGLAQLHAKYHARWQDEVTKNTENTAMVNYGAAMASAVDDAQQDAAQDGVLLDTGRLQANLEAIRDHGSSIGLRNDQVDKLMLATIQAKTLTSRDPELLSLFDMKSAAGAKLGDTPDGVVARKNTVDALTHLWKTQEGEARQEQERQDKLAANHAQQQIIDQLIKDPNAPISDEQMAPALKLNGHFKIDMMEWQKKLREGKVADDPAAVSHLYQDILQGKAGMPEVVAAIQGGQLQTPEGISKAKGFLTSMEDYRKRPDGILDSGMAKTVLGDISRLGQADGITKDLFGKSATTPAGRQAELDFRVGAMKWDMAHPNADPVERDKFLSTFGNSIINGLSAGRDVESGTYVRPQDATTANDRVLPQPQPQAQPQAAQPQAQAAQPQAATQAAPAPQTPQSPWSPPPEMVPAIEERAKALGVTPQVIIDSMNRKRQQLLNAPAVPATPPQAPEKRSDLGSPGAFQMAAINPRAAVEAVRSVAQRFGLGGGQQAATSIPSATQEGSNSDVINSRRVERIRSSSVGPVLQEVAQQTGFDADKLMAIASIESGGNPNASTGSYHGLYQLSQAEFDKYGQGGSIYNPRDNAVAAVRSLQDKSARFTREFGREPSATELYLMHQQGEAGLRAHEQQLDAPAWTNMARTGEGKRKGERWAKLAVWGNVPTDMRKYFGSVENLTSRQFLAVWTSKILGVGYERALAMNGGAGSAEG